MSQGYSFAACGGDLGVTRQTMWEWRNSIPAFSYAAELGEVKRQKWWEARAMENAQTSNGNAAMIQFGLKNVAQADFREKIEVAQSGTVTHTHGFNEEALSALSRADLEAFSAVAGRLLAAPAKGERVN